MTDAPITREWIQALSPVVVSLLVSGLWAWLNHRSRLAHERSLEAERRVGHQALEVLKAELTFDAEVRRQVAGKKVDAVLQMMKAGDELLSQLILAEHDPGTATKALVEATRTYFDELRGTQHFFVPETARKLTKYAEEVTHFTVAWKAGNADELHRAVAAFTDLLTLVREELQIVPRVPAVTIAEGATETKAQQGTS